MIARQLLYSLRFVLFPAFGDPGRAGTSRRDGEHRELRADQISEAAWYQGRPSADDYLPFFSCKAVGDVLVDAAQSHRKCQILVLYGHTHGGGEIQVLENLRVLTAPAEYGKPDIQRIIEVE